MGYELRRALRELLGPEIKGLPRAVALELADDANETTRQCWASLEDLARWTAAKDTNVVRDALKRLGAAGWEFRVPIGAGKDGRILYAVPGRRMTFRVPDFEGRAATTPKGESPLPVPSQGRVTTPSEGVTTPSEGVTTPSEGVRTTPFSSIPSDSSSLSVADRVVQAAAVVPAGQEREFIDYINKNHNPKGPGWWHTVSNRGDLPDLAESYRTARAEQAATARPTLPAWCGRCGKENPAAVRFNQNFRVLEDGRRCPDCHPAAVKENA